ncbi:hypothetical protein NQ317_014541 [Molorchus minor]|uniref:Ig-like domain-containing protein n=1 Tax=Molorchus minor TaxID=1323400 RepID=A0ABQ9J204_9CUCU|nr:hypothetical protein NQ317_014541 [Molorchus minor]
MYTALSQTSDFPPHRLFRSIPSPTPPQYVFWYHNDHMINYDTARGGISVETEPGPRTQSRLTIRDTNDADSGNYTCSASNTEPASIYVFVSEDNIEDVGCSLIVKIPNTKTKIPRIFVVTDVGNMLELFRKYLSLRPPHVKHKRLFLYYKAGKCSSQPVGKNTMEKIPSVVASYLKLPDVACYTGHCLRRSSATLLADAGVDITTIKRHAGWKSTTVAEGYIENSIENKTKIVNQVLVGDNVDAILMRKSCAMCVASQLVILLIATFAAAMR